MIVWGKEGIRERDGEGGRWKEMEREKEMVLIFHGRKSLCVQMNIQPTATRIYYSLKNT